MTTYAYLRVSTADQDIEAQRREIESYCSRKDLRVDEWLEIEMSSRRSQRKRRIEELLGKLKRDDALIVSELSRLGRSISEVVLLVESLIRRKVSFIAIAPVCVVPLAAPRGCGNPNARRNGLLRSALI